MRIFLNDHYGNEYEEISLDDFYAMIKPSSKEDTNIYVRNAIDCGYIELSYNVGMNILSTLAYDSTITINVYPDKPESYDYGFDIYIDY